MAFLVLALCAAHGAHASSCVAQSGSHTAALIELYTSERCSGCPRAERRLAALERVSGSLVALVLHVDERSYAADGREDPLARRRLTPRQRLALLHSPAVLLQGRDFEEWRGPQLEQAVSRVNARPAAARMSLQIVGREPQALRVLASAEVLRREIEDAALYLAAFEVRGGQRVALAWQGPFALVRGTLREELPLPRAPAPRAGPAGAAGFLQDRRSGEVLQALQLGPC